MLRLYRPKCQHHLEADVENDSLYKRINVHLLQRSIGTLYILMTIIINRKTETDIIGHGFSINFRI